MKPEPIRVGVEGIAPKPIELTPAPIDWGRLCALPPFQMFAAEKMRNTTEADAIEHAAAFVQSSGVDADLLEAYCQWHAKKGYWPNETPMGECIEHA